MRSGPYKPGRAAAEFLSERLAQGAVVPVAQLLTEAEQEGIDLTTLRRAAKRLGVTKLVCWALPPEESAAPVEVQGPAVTTAADSDPRVEQAVAEVSELVAQGLDRGVAIYQRVCLKDRELARQVEAVLDKR